MSFDWINLGWAIGIGILIFTLVSVSVGYIDKGTTWQTDLITAQRRQALALEHQAQIYERIEARLDAINAELIIGNKAWDD